VNDGSGGQFALVMSGGGARAAYQVGMLRWLVRRYPDLHVPILTGVSAGALNAAFLASHLENLRTSVEELADLWSHLTAEQVFRVDTRSLARNVLRLGLKLVSGGAATAPRAHAAVDTKPLWSLLERALGERDGELPGIEVNLGRGALKAIAITTSSYTTGQSITWVQGCGIPQWERAHRRSINVKLGVRHVMASAALPIFFPAIEVDGQWFGDGGIRLSAPLSPAVHLGADRILAISTRYARTRTEADQPAVIGYPPPAQIMGALFNAVFLDLFDADALTMERMNRLIETLPPELRRDYRRVRLVVLRPSQDLGKLANQYEPRLPGAFRFMTRGLGTRETRSNDLLSLLMFQPDYLSRLIELGEADAEARRDDIDRLLKGTQPGQA
jgi:NTE family protein